MFFCFLSIQILRFASLPPILGRPMVESFQIPLQALRRAFKKRGGRSVDQDAREKLGVPALEKFEVSLSLRRCVAVVWAALIIPLHTSLSSIPAMRKKATIRLKIRQIERFLRTFGRCRSCLAAACPHEIFA